MTPVKVANSCVIVDFDGRNPCWVMVILGMRMGSIFLCIIFSRIFDKTGNRDTGRLFDTMLWLPFLNIGTMLALFQALGTSPFDKDKLNMVVRLVESSS